MDDWIGKIVAGAIGGLLSSTITATVAYIVGLKQRRLTFRIAEKQNLEKFIDDAAAYAADTEKLKDLTEELHGQETITPKDVENLFALHPVDSIEKTPSILQRASTIKIPESSVRKQKQATEARRELWLCYKNALRNNFSDMTTLRGLIGDVYRQTALALEAIEADINQITARLASYPEE